MLTERELKQIQKRIKNKILKNRLKKNFTSIDTLPPR